MYNLCDPAVKVSSKIHESSFYLKEARYKKVIITVI